MLPLLFLTHNRVWRRLLLSSWRLPLWRGRPPLSLTFTLTGETKWRGIARRSQFHSLSQLLKHARTSNTCISFYETGVDLASCLRRSSRRSTLSLEIRQVRSVENVEFFCQNWTKLERSDDRCIRFSRLRYADEYVGDIKLSSSSRESKVWSITHVTQETSLGNLFLSISTHTSRRFAF